MLTRKKCSIGWLSIAIGILFVSLRLGDDGGQAICRALLKNKTLTHVHLGSNDLGEPTAAILSQVLKNISGIIILGAVHFTPNEFVTGALFLRLGLPSTLIRRENEAWDHGNHMIFLPDFSSKTSPKWVVMATIFNFSSLVWTENKGCDFSVNPPFYSGLVQAGFYLSCRKPCVKALSA